MHSKVMAGRFFCDCPAVRRTATSRVDRARNPMDTCENWDTLNEDYDGDEDLAAFLIENAGQVFNEKIHVRESQ